MDRAQSWSEELIARQAELRRFARRLAADAHFAEDLLQELNLAALDPRRAPVEAPLAWMKGVLRRLFRSQLRRDERRQRRERWVAQSRESEAGEDAPQAELARVLAGLARLDEPYRTTLSLRFLEGRTPAQVASATGSPLRTVHTRTTRGLALLRRALAGPSGERGLRGHAWLARALPAAAVSAIAAGIAAGIAAVTWIRAPAPESESAAESAAVCPTFGGSGSDAWELMIFEDRGPSVPGARAHPELATERASAERTARAPSEASPAVPRASG
jgi:RNA polymerase sigma factor (sigma-70 family)